MNLESIPAESEIDPGRAEEPVLVVTDAHRTFGNTRALDGASIAVLPGEVHGLVGANGAGKSTLVKAVSGALKLDSGLIRIRDFEADTVTPREAQKHGLATIYQDPSLVPPLGLTENIVLGRESSRAGFLNRGIDQDAVDSSLKRVGLKRRSNVVASQLTPADQQLLEIAKALYREASVVLMDEPTASLGGKERDRLFGVIESLKADGVGIVYISHNLGEVLEICDRVTVMRDGKIVATTAADELDEDKLVQQMIGRVLVQSERVESERGGVTMSVRNLGQGSRLGDISFDVHEGEVLGITGLVGSGRSRLARVLFGAEQFDQGSITLGGDDYRPGSPHAAISAGVGLVPQDRKRDGLHLHMSGADNVVMTHFPTTGGIVRRKAENADAMKWIEYLDIKTPSPAAPPIMLSGGNQQKVAIARWLNADAKVLIFDEPGQAVDVGAKAEIFRAVRDIASQGRAVIVISEEVEELVLVVDRTLVMRAGRISGELPHDQIDEENVVALAMGANKPKEEEVGVENE